MKELARELRKCLSMLARKFEYLDDPLPQNWPRPTPILLAGVKVSTPQTERVERNLAHVQSLALSRGLHIVPNWDGSAFDIFTREGVLIDGWMDRSLGEIEAALKQPPRAKTAPKRKRGARGAAPVTLAKHA